MNQSRMKPFQRAWVFFFLFTLQFNTVGALCLDHFFGERVRVYHSLWHPPHSDSDAHAQHGSSHRQAGKSSNLECHLSAVSVLPSVWGDGLITSFKDGVLSLPIRVALFPNGSAAQGNPTFPLKQLFYPPPDKPPRR